MLKRFYTEIIARVLLRRKLLKVKKNLERELEVLRRLKLHTLAEELQVTINLVKMQINFL